MPRDRAAKDSTELNWAQHEVVAGGWEQGSSATAGTHGSRAARAAVSASPGSKTSLVPGDILLSMGLCFSPTKFLSAFSISSLIKAQIWQILPLTRLQLCFSLNKWLAQKQFIIKYDTGKRSNVSNHVQLKVTNLLQTTLKTRKWALCHQLRWTVTFHERRASLNCTNNFLTCNKEKMKGHTSVSFEISSYIQLQTTIGHSSIQDFVTISLTIPMDCLTADSIFPPPLHQSQYSGGFFWLFACLHKLQWYWQEHSQ